MNNRPIDRTKKSNIKCEHCKYWDKTKEDHDWSGKYLGNICTKHNYPRYYYNRCKCFDWAESEE